MSSKTLSTKIQRLEGKKDPQSGKWSKTAVFEPPESDILKSRGRLFAVLDLAAPSNFDFNLAERLVFDTLSEKYFSELEGSPLSSLERALLEVRHQLVNLTASPKKGLVRDLDFNIIVAVLWGQVLYLARMGTVATYILREGNLKEVDLGEEKTLTTASGLIKPEDVVIIGSKEFKKQFPKDRLFSSMDNLDSLIESLPESSGISALVLKAEIFEAVSPAEQIAFAPPFKERFGIILRTLLNTKERLATIMKNIAARIRIPNRGPSEAPPSVYVRGQLPVAPHPRRRKVKPSWILAFLILLFSGSVAFTIYRHRSKVKENETTTILTETEEKLQEAENQLDWNNTRAREIAEAIIQDLNRALSYGGNKEQLREYLGKAQAILDNANKTTRFSNPAMVYDLTLQSPEASPANLCGVSGALFIPIPEMKTIFQLDISSSPTKIEKVVSEDVSNLQHLTVSSSFLWVVNETGLSVVDRSDSSLQSDLLETDFTWSEVASAVSYEAFGENLYLLNPARNQIFKVSYLEEEFSDPTPWIEGEVNLSEAVDFAIDGEIYILLKGGTVLKFLRGEKESFDLLYEGFVEPIAIYTDDTLEYIYILDRGKKGMIVFTKEGAYHSQYLYDGEDSVWDDIKDFWVNSEGKAIYILAGAKVFKVDL